MARTSQTIDAQLASAAKKANLARVRMLLRKGARPDVLPWTALAYAVEGGDAEILACLIEVQPSQAAMEQALQSAATSLRRDMVQMLLDAGANIAFDPDAEETFKWLREFGNAQGAEEMRRMLVAHMMATKLESAMGDGEPKVQASSGGMQPL